MKFGTHIRNDVQNQSRRGAIVNYLFERKYMKNFKNLKKIRYLFSEKTLPPKYRYFFYKYQPILSVFISLFKKKDGVITITLLNLFLR